MDAQVNSVPHWPLSDPTPANLVTSEVPLGARDSHSTRFAFLPLSSSSKGAVYNQLINNYEKSFGHRYSISCKDEEAAYAFPSPPLSALESNFSVGPITPGTSSSTTSHPNDSLYSTQGSCLSPAYPYESQPPFAVGIPGSCSSLFDGQNIPKLGSIPEGAQAHPLGEQYCAGNQPVAFPIYGLSADVPLHCIWPYSY